MSFRAVDTLLGYQIEPGDFLEVPGIDEPVLVHSIDILKDGYQINYLDEYMDETLSFNVVDEDVVTLLVFDDED